MLSGQTDSHNHLPEYFGELGVGKGKSPESEIAGRVRNSAENVFDRVDSLEDHDLLEVGLFAGSFGPVLCDQWPWQATSRERRSLLR